ncbi:inositol monophosphatase family protein [Frigidibacter sp. MR17.24]|uniref:inositol monophosphatase family protein n=1 Tax=Frigidibacter sp. MR17.24 TaxID=3127345 RepID=UPI003012A814
MTFTLDDLCALDQLMRAACADQVMPRFGQLARGDIGAKTSPDDLVTVADVEAERQLTAALLARFPGAAVIGEETAGPGFDFTADPLLFVIDPVDGTWNFAKGLPVFGCMVSVLARGDCIAGALHYPLQGDTLLGLAGGGVHRRDAAGRLAALPPLPGGAAMGAGMLPLSQFTATGRAALMGAFPDLPRVVTVQCSAYEYRLLLTGEVDFFLSTGLKTWDHAAGQMMLDELGGRSATLRGTRWPDARPEDLQVSARAPEVLAEALVRLTAALGPAGD